MIEWLFAAASVIALARALLGPTFADRLLAANLVTGLVTIYMVMYAIRIGTEFYLDIAIVLSVLSLVGTLAVAKYAVKK